MIPVLRKRLKGARRNWWHPFHEKAAAPRVGKSVEFPNVLVWSDLSYDQSLIFYTVRVLGWFFHLPKSPPPSEVLVNMVLAQTYFCVEGGRIGNTWQKNQSTAATIFCCFPLSSCGRGPSVLVFMKGFQLNTISRTERETFITPFETEGVLYCAVSH